MTATLIIDNAVHEITPLGGDSADLWLATDSLKAATGWELKPEGACKDDVCVPIPLQREREFVRDGAFNIAALAKYLGQPFAADVDHHAWVIGEAAAARSEALRSLQAPDFALPDLDGVEHSLSDYRGKKVFLASWASW
ncbi:hypothetical protein AYO38_05510 [bacterium SCGC AG-212-C10]|nr:hypothetical protein AYO38_05510 [bacterium SCGC AG-212-C10]